MFILKIKVTENQYLILYIKVNILYSLDVYLSCMATAGIILHILYVGLFIYIIFFAIYKFLNIFPPFFLHFVDTFNFSEDA